MIRIKIAVYGKGGIGKSTISANLSAALAKKGHRVLQIGCDPKHDSTRLLLGGRIPMTVLQYIRDVPPEKRRPEDFVYRGYGDTACVEAGGPEPGVGCAGRGIITTFELLEQQGVRPSCFDFTLYDVLGDVVCGGFAVPIRNEYADAIYIVTSGEYLALYAANNILRGIKNFTENGNRVAGIIFNERGGPEEQGRVARFAESVRLPVVAHVPRSGLFAQAEKEGCTLIERYHDTREAGIFDELAGHVDSARLGDGSLLHPALPLSDSDLERVVLLREDRRTVEKFLDLPGYADPAVNHTSEEVSDRRPLIGCAFAGALAVTSKIADAAIVMHCPRSCVMSRYERIIRSDMWYALRSGQPYRHETEKRLVITDMTDDDFIFGGEKKLVGALESVIREGYSTIFIVTACPPGIIGDDIEKISVAVSRENPGVRIIPVKVDGDLAGDYMQGTVEAYRAVTDLIPRGRGTARPGDRSVNIIGEGRIGRRDRAVTDLFGRLKISVNSVFLSQTDTNSLAKFNNANLNVPVCRDDSTANLLGMLKDVSDLPVLDVPLPTGFFETCEWLKAVAGVFNVDEDVLAIIEQEKAAYMERIDRLRPDLEGTRILISTYSQNIDWIYDISKDLGMEIIKTGLTYSPFAGSFKSRYEGTLPIAHDYTVENRSADILALEPDLVLFTFPALARSDMVKNASLPYSPGYGFHAALPHAEYWAHLMRHSLPEGWKADGELIQ